MIFTCMLFINVAFLFLSLTSGNEYEDDEKMYMLVSPDQHSRTPRLEDFFWTGSGDGPPPPDLATTMISPSTPIVRTTTVLATVYLDSYPPQAVTDKSSGECVLNCDATPDSLEPEIPEDRRYWLLTVIQGSTPDSLQLRLARLYQKAFLRQQERHLGIIKSLDAPTPRKKHEVHSFVINYDNNLSQIDPHTIQTPQKYNIQTSMTSLDDLSVNVLENSDNETMLSNTNKTDHLNYVEVISLHDIKTSRAIQPTHLSRNSWILVAPTVEVRKRSIEEFDDMEDKKEDMIDLPLEFETDGGNGSVLFKREIIKPEQQPPVQVYIQNITESTEGKIHIVYVVLVGGRAVPAAVAARDMRLVRDAEVATELNAVVTTKAEPAYLKAAAGLEGAPTATVQGTELWALAIGSTIAVLLLLVVIVLLCVAHRKKSLKSAASLRAYRHELMREVQRSHMKQINDDKDSKLVSVVSPSRTRPSSVLLPVYRTGSASGSSTSSSGISEVAAALRKRQKKPHAFRMPQKSRVGTTDSLLEAAGLDSSDSGRPSPTSYLSMPSINTFPRGNIVEPLSRILEPVSVRHLDEESPRERDRNTTATRNERDRNSDNNQRNGNRGTRRNECDGDSVASRSERGGNRITHGSDRDREKGARGSERDGERVVRRQMSSQLVRGGSAARDPGVLGPRVWDLHCQRVRDVSQSPVASKESSRMRRRFNELMDDAFTLFGSTNTTTTSQETVKDNYDIEGVTQARNENVRVRGRSAGPAHSHVSSVQDSLISDPSLRPRPRTARAPNAHTHAPPAPAPAWSAPATSLPHPTVSPALITAQGRLGATDPALPLISAIKTEIQRVRDSATKNM